MPDRLGVSATGFEALGIGVRFCPTRVVRSNAVTGVKDLLHANPEVKVVYAHKDHMTLGALRVPCEADRTDVKVAGVDGLGEALKAMRFGDRLLGLLPTTRATSATWQQVAQAAKAGNQVPAGKYVGNALIPHDSPQIAL